jgi:hypothetical protein
MLDQGQDRGEFARGEALGIRVNGELELALDGEDLGLGRARDARENRPGKRRDSGEEKYGARGGEPDQLPPSGTRIFPRPGHSGR